MKKDVIQLSNADIQSVTLERTTKTWTVKLKDGNQKCTHKLTGTYTLSVIQNTSMVNVVADCDADNDLIKSVVCTRLADEVVKIIGTLHGKI